MTLKTKMLMFSKEDHRWLRTAGDLGYASAREQITSKQKKDDLLEIDGTAGDCLIKYDDGKGFHEAVHARRAFVTDSETHRLHESTQIPALPEELRAGSPSGAISSDATMTVEREKWITKLRKILLDRQRILDPFGYTAQDD